MPPIIIFGFLVTAIACTYLVLAESSFGSDITESISKSWDKMLKALAERVPNSKPAAIPLTEEEHLKELVSSLESVGEKVSELLKPARAKVADNITTQAHLKVALEKSQERLTRWHERAKKQVSEDNELLARQALERKLHYQMEVEIYSELLEEDKVELETLRANLLRVEAKVSEVSMQIGQLVTRARNAANANQVHRKLVVSYRQALLSNLDTQLQQLRNVGVTDFVLFSTSAIEGFSELLREAKSEVSTMEDNVLNWSSSRRGPNSTHQTEAIQQALDELKRASADDQLSD